MEFDVSNTYNEYSQNEIINRCNFENNHLMNTSHLTGDSILQQQELTSIIDVTR